MTQFDPHLNYDLYSTCAIITRINPSPPVMSGARKRLPPSLRPQRPLGAITLTFGEVAENHVGMQQMGDKADEGLCLEDLERSKALFETKGFKPYIVHLNEALSEVDDVDESKVEEAAVLVIPDGVHAMDINPDELEKEQNSLTVDTKAFMYGRVVNKKARYNLCFGEDSQEPDYEAKKGRIVAFRDIPHTNSIRESLPIFFGDKTKGLKCEGNYYYDPSSCGIGFHGDTERMIVVAVRIGTSIPLHYQWYYQKKPVGKRVELVLRHGDMYAMSAKATGNDWKKSSVYTLRHAAGSKKFTTIKS